MTTIEVKVPDIGDFEEVEVIEVLVKPGDRVAVEQSLITVESDKASMEIPSSAAGVVRALKVKLGDKVSEGSPLVELEGNQWYRTGDLVREDPDGVLVFQGRLKRFVKLGGEMISLPAVEEVLNRQYAGEADEGPVLAVEATPSEDHPELVLFTTRDLDRETANRHVREAGLSALHNIRRVVHIPELPLLASGKTDYRALTAMLQDGPGAPAEPE